MTITKNSTDQEVIKELLFMMDKVSCDDIPWHFSFTEKQRSDFKAWRQRFESKLPKVKYVVYDGIHRADNNHPMFGDNKPSDWVQKDFFTFEEAKAYAKHWCFPFLPGRLDWLQPDMPFEHQMGGMITIKTEEVK